MITRLGTFARLQKQQQDDGDAEKQRIVMYTDDIASSMLFRCAFKDCFLETHGKTQQNAPTKETQDVTAAAKVTVVCGSEMTTIYDDYF